MAEFAAPAWLAVSVLVAALIRWLHRKDSTSTAGHVVPSLLLWTSVSRREAVPGTRRETDPRWRIRAAVAVAISLALAGPSITRETPGPVTVWLDESGSLSTIEGGDARWRQALDPLADALRVTGVSDIEFRGLSRPTEPLSVSPSDRNSWSQLIETRIRSARGRRDLPRERNFASGRGHWLITDGADPRLAEWLPTVPIGRVFNVGTISENAGIIRLGLRPSRRDRAMLHGMAVLAATGSADASERQLVLSAGGRTVWTEPVVLPESGQITVPFSIAATEVEGGQIEASLQPRDGFELDDDVSLETSVLQRSLRVAVQGECGEFLNRAIATHPAFRISKGDHDVSISCGPQPTEAADLRVWQGARWRLVDVPPSWSPAVRDLSRLVLPDVPFWAAEHDAEIAGEAMLRAGEAVLIAERRDGRRSYDVFLDLSSPDFGHTAEYPLLLAGLIGWLADDVPLDPVASISFAAEDSNIVPRFLRPSAPDDIQPIREPMDLTLWFILIAGILTVLEGALTVRPAALPFAPPAGPRR